jgi:hypothetical protein
MAVKISEERITQFLTGRDQMLGIINMECGYNDDDVSIIYRHPIAGKRMKKVDFEPFVWAKVSGAQKLYCDKKGIQDQRLLRSKMSEFGIVAKGLNIYADDGFTTDRMENGYRVLFEAKGKMSFNKFIQFFKQGGCDLWGEDKLFLAVSPVEQYMMKSGKRMFKGFEDYDELLRMEFDLETDGLDPYKHAINQIGIRTNKGYEKILTITGDTPEERDDNELRAIDEFFRIVNEIKPDVLTGHNSENFDWNYIIVRCNVLGSDIKEISAPHFKQPIYKKKRKTVLKLGGETEYFNQTIIWGFNITDSLHAIRRAQAIDSNLKSASLKYVSEYINAKRDNRVYVPGNQIGKIWADVENDYAFNNSTGEWYVIDVYNELKPEFSIVDGRYIVERYLFDDLYETDKVELNYNQANFLLTKVLPTTFTKACTMGTAGTWKLIMMAWSYENGLAIPDFSPAGKFTGGLSRLMRVGYVSRVVKLDYNSLYPSINITWETKPDLDVTGVMLSLLGYILDKREEYKGLKGKAGKKYKALKKELEELENKLSEIEISERKNELSVWKSEEGANDKKQLPFKIFANSFFGSFGAPNLFPWGDLKCAEKTTCIGRQSLRLMVYWFKRRGYEPVVGDSFLYDTPVYVKHKTTGLIEIKTISELFNKNESQTDVLGREYDLSNKDYYVLCRSGWIDPLYVYRHKTDKDIHRVTFENGLIDVTADHSLFDENKERLHSKDVVVGETKLEMADLSYLQSETSKISVSDIKTIKYASDLLKKIGNNNGIPTDILNSDVKTQRLFYNTVINKMVEKDIKLEDLNKVLLSGLLFLKKNIK